MSFWSHWCCVLNLKNVKCIYAGCRLPWNANGSRFLQKLFEKSFYFLLSELPLNISVFKKSFGKTAPKFSWRLTSKLSELSWNSGGSAQLWCEGKGEKPQRGWLYCFEDRVQEYSWSSLDCDLWHAVWLLTPRWASVTWAQNTESLSYKVWQSGNVITLSTVCGTY